MKKVKRNFHPSVILLLLIINIIDQAAFAQPPLQFQHLTFDQGLSHNRVTAFTQDKYGLIWIGTNDGLNRFDGYKVDIYQKDRDNKNSLPDNSVRCLFTDSHGVVWVGTANGLASYDYRSNSFRSFFHNSKDEKSLSNSSISCALSLPIPLSSILQTSNPLFLSRESHRSPLSFLLINPC